MTTLVQNEAAFNTVLGMLVLIYNIVIYYCVMVIFSIVSGMLIIYYSYMFLSNYEQHLVPDALGMVV